MTTLSMGIIGDFDPTFEPHLLTSCALKDAGDYLGLSLSAEWLTTDKEHDYAPYSALICAPGSPYRSITGALRGIRWARENDIPLLGTCGGFQHMVLEYARHVMGFADAEHAEYDPYGSRLFIKRLSCSLAGRRMRIVLESGSKAARLYSGLEAEEAFYCNFGLNTTYEEALQEAGLRISGRDADGEARVVEISRLRFYVGTLFVPQAQSRKGYPHPLITGLLRAGAEDHARCGTAA